ncbi:MAG: MFS transporter [SAR324 cluster bacterium]|nr:MFS transporter [SAR324 cluster bacterium]
MNRNYISLILLSFSLACDYSLRILAFTAIPLLAMEISGDDSLYSVPFSAVYFVALLATFPLSLAMQKFGRKKVFVFASGISTIGGLMILHSITTKNFALLVAGLGLTGIQLAAGFYYRFAAIELSPEGKAGRGISMVLAGGVIAALFAPSFGIYLKADGFYQLFTGYSALQFLVLLFILCVKFPKIEASKPTMTIFKGLIQKRKIYLPILAGVLSYNLMTFIMVASPGAMHHSGINYQGVSLVIQWHMLGMFLPSFFTGKLMEKWGGHKTLFWGGVITLGAIAANVSGQSLSYYWVGLFLLGLGWNLTYVAATGLLAKTYEPKEMSMAQGVNEVMILGTNTFTTSMAGIMVAHLGWTMVNWTILPFTLGIIFLAFYMRKQALA